MKRITIGRNPNCDIVYAQNMVSRNHAILNIYPSGKYEIINMGTNGTKVNGTLIANGQPYPLKRGDAVVFAGQYPLDWQQVPDSGKPLRLALIIGGGVIALGLLAWGVIWAINHDWSSDEACPDLTEQVDETTEPTDSTTTAPAEGDATATTPTAPEQTPTETRQDKTDRANRFFPNRNNATPPNNNSNNNNNRNNNNNQTTKPDPKPQTPAEAEDEWMH